MVHSPLQRHQNRRRSWVLTALTALAVLFALDWLLGWIIWLPLYSGLFGFLVAGLIAGGIAFRIARPLRPVRTGQLVALALVLGVVNSSVALYWEYHHVAHGVGDLPGFGKLLARAYRAGRPIDEVTDRVVREFKARLRDEYPPGGAVGYARWCFAGGEMKVSVDDASDHVTVSHRRWVWLIRSIAAALLTCTGLWFSFEGLRSPLPVRNVLIPGEEYEEID
ncbi:MAG TPA: hypothetical protein VNT79_07435 [Phycisphaerae bacterium]|nr:hypothetical protein [Phycisphaerae bacterium]